MLTIKEVFYLTNRGGKGFVRSAFAMLNIHLPVPDHSTLSKRGKTLKVKLPRKTKESLNLVLDSTGLKIYGEGEWKVRKHGRQQWKNDSGYHMRSLAETIMFRLKIIFSDRLSARLLETQTTQAWIRCLALNKMTHLGMPESYQLA